MSRNAREPRSPHDAKSDVDTTSYQQCTGGDDPPAARLPHERDESARAAGDRLSENPAPSDRQISQAGEDVERGLVDTDRRGVPNDLPNARQPEENDDAKH